MLMAALCVYVDEKENKKSWEMGNRAGHLISTEWIFEVSGFLGSVLNQKEMEQQNWFAVGMKATSKGHPRGLQCKDSFGYSTQRDRANRDSSMQYLIYHGILTANGHFRSGHDIRNE